jgi:hypothetical protein
MKYNSRGFLGFSVDHETKDPDESVRADHIRKAIIKRLADLNDEDLISSVELDDTCEWVMEELDITKCKNGVGDWEITPLHETFDTFEEAESRVKELQAEEDRKLK